MMDEKIINFIRNRGITRLCHFTRSENMAQILTSEDGIKAVDFLDKELYTPNDKLRLDGKKDYINCSVQYPNTWFLDKVKNADPLFKEWVIIFINPLLAALDTSKFCYRNAAYACGAYIKSGYEAFMELFQPTVGRFSRTTQMLKCCPTDDQAEVLIYKNIPRSEIIGIAVSSEEQAECEVSRYNVLMKIGTLSIKPPDIYVAPDLFSRSWSDKTKCGIKPTEKKYERRVLE